VITWLQLTLTLPGIAGIILSIGMGVDANVIIFARIKEELRNGKTLKAAIDLGFKEGVQGNRGFERHYDDDGGCTDHIRHRGHKGFGITLLLGVALSFFTAITITRIMLKTVSKHRHYEKALALRRKRRVEKKMFNFNLIGKKVLFLRAFAADNVGGPYRIFCEWCPA